MQIVCSSAVILFNIFYLILKRIAVNLSVLYFNSFSASISILTFMPMPTPGLHPQDSGSLLSGCNDKMLRVFDLSRPDSDPQLLAGSSSAVKSAVWTREPAMLSSCCEDKDITSVIR